MDYILIKDLEVFARHGVYPQEREQGQVFVVSAKLGVDLRMAGMTDDLNASVNYAEVCTFIHNFMTQRTYQLIESVAERLAEAILQNYGLVKEVTIEVKKPSAPIGLPLQYPSVCITRKWHRAVVALGSNLGDKHAYLTQAELALDARKDCRIVKSAKYIETKPYGVENQPEFLNGAVLIDTLLLPEELLNILHAIESSADRVREQHWGPRTLDLDIIFYDKDSYESEDLVIPHADLQNRTFVLEPLMELCPNYRHPVLGKTVRELYAKLQKTNS